jgi:hypothetical protein
MKKWSVVLAVFSAFSSHAAADRSPDNLKGFVINDICPISVIVSIDGETSKSDVERLNALLLEQDILFGTNFKNKTNYLTCTQGSYMSFEVFKSKADIYVYSFNLSIFSNSTTTQGIAGPVKVIGSEFYNNGAFGVSGSLENLKNAMDSNFKNAFQGLVLDWRKTH